MSEEALFDHGFTPWETEEEPNTFAESLGYELGGEPVTGKLSEGKLFLTDSQGTPLAFQQKQVNGGSFIDDTLAIASLKHQVDDLASTVGNQIAEINRQLSAANAPYQGLIARVEIIENRLRSLAGSFRNLAYYLTEQKPGE